MYKNARDSYLENAVLSANPQQLRKMLIDGAIRFSRQAIENWNGKKFDDGLDCINRVRDIISEILATTKQLDKETLKIRQVYVFLLKEVTEASFRNDIQRMQGVIDVLEVEQETWSLVLEQLRNGTSDLSGNQAGHPATPKPYGAQANQGAGTTTGVSQSGGISFEA